MSKGNGPLDFEATLDAAKLNYMLDEIERRIKGTASTAVREADKMDKAFSHVGMMIGGYFTAAFGAKIISDIVNVRGEFQQLGIAFETILKNKEKSDRLMQEVTEFAAKTPFDLKGVASGAKQLLAYGEASEDVIGTMRKLGDIASGLSIPFGDLVYLYGTSRTQGKLMTKDLMQFAGRGIPIIDELSKVLKVSKSRVLEMASESKIGFEQLEQVINNLTSSTGMFGGMMDKQAKSLPGLISNLGDAWDRMLNNIGTNSQDTFAEAITLATTVVDNYQEVIDILKVIVATYGTYRAAVILNSIAVNGYSKALGLAIVKEKLLALAQKATPWGLALAGLTAVIGAFVVYNKSLSDTSDKLEEFNKSTNSAVAESNILFEELKKTAVGTDERRAAVLKLNSIHGEYLQNLNLEKATLVEIEAAQRGANDELVRKMTLEAKNKDLQVWFEKEIEIRKAVAKAGYDFDKILQESKVKTSKNGNPLFTSFGNEIDQLLMNYYVVQEEKKKIEELYDKAFKSVTTPTKKETTTPDPLPDKKTFEDKLQAIKKQYENYYKWVEHYGKESADLQFKELIKGGDSYLEYLNNQIALLENKKRNSAESDNLTTLLSSKDDITGKKSRLESVQDEIEKAKVSYKSLSDYISYLNQKIEETKSKNDGSEQTSNILQFLQNELNEAERTFRNESKETFEQLLINSKNYADQRIAIEKEYQDTVKKLDRESLGEVDYAKALQLAEEERNKKLQEINAEVIKQSSTYRLLSGDLSRLSNTTLKALIEKVKEWLKTGKLTVEEYQNLKQLMDQTEGAISKNDVENLNLASQLFGDMASRIGDTNAGISSALHSASQLIEEFGQLKTAQNDAVVFGSLVSIFSTAAEFLDKQLGRQKRIADIEAERIEYQRLQKLEIEQINQEIQDQLDLLDKALGIDKMNEFADTYKKLQQSAIESRKALEDYKFEVLPAPDQMNATIDIASLRELTKAKNDIEALNKALSAGLISQEDYDNAIAYLDTIKLSEEEMVNLEAQYRQLLTGSSFDSILEGITSAFEQGMSSAEYFTSSFEDMMRKALLQALSINSLQEPLQDWYAQFALFSEGGLSKDEIAQLKASLEQIYINAEEQAKLIEEASGISIGGNVSAKEDKLSSAVKGINQQTAGLIAGYMNAIRINQAQGLSIMNRKLEVLSRIDNNTLSSARFAKLIYEFMQTNAKNLPSTRIEG